MKRQPSIPHYVSSTVFFESVGIHFNLGARLISLGVLKPVAYCNNRALFSAGIKAVAQAKAVVAVHRVRQRRVTQNVKELQHA